MNNSQSSKPAREYRAGLFFGRGSTLFLLIFLSSCYAFQTGCEIDRGPVPSAEEQTIRPINDVLDDHAAELMKIEGVVGVYAGALENGDPCLVVMLRDDGPERRNEIPGVLEGYPVRVEVGGEIRPLRP